MDLCETGTMCRHTGRMNLGEKKLSYYAPVCVKLNLHFEGHSYMRQTLMKALKPAQAQMREECTESPSVFFT